jgi:hypothetical protein
MNTRLATLFLAAMTAVASYVLLVINGLVPRFFQVTFRLKPDEVASFMLGPTRFAVGSSWVFAVVPVAALSAALFLVHLCPRHATRVVVAALCVEALTVWIAFFCYCYDGFCGPISLHRGPDFDAAEFCRFEAGVFPVTLILILIPLIGCLVRWSAPSVRAEPGAAPNGGPTTPLGSSGAAAGPPSVS